MRKILITLAICFLLVGVPVSTAIFIQKINNSPDIIISRIDPNNGKNSITIEMIKEGGYRVSWSHNLDLIAFDQQEADGYYDIYTMNPDGTDEKCLTDNSNLPHGHKGCAEWHPSGEYLVFTCEKERYFGKHLFLLSRIFKKILAVPGAGGYNCDLWLMNSDGSKFWQLTDLPTKTRLLDKQPYTGILHPHFSHDGTKLSWVERIDRGGKFGEWTLNVADLIFLDGTPRLENITIYQPGDQHFWYECSGFSPDDSKIIFSGNLKTGQDENHADIYTLDLETQELERLTTSMHVWDEHAHYSPSGDKIVWLSSEGYPISDTRKFLHELQTEYWLMDADGTNKTRITFYNENAEDNIHIICSDNSWNADGTKLAGTILIVEGKKIKGGGIVIIELLL